MRRPCFALIVLFTAFAGSLFAVRSAEAQLTMNAFLPISTLVSQMPGATWYSLGTGYDDAYDSAMCNDEFPVLDEAKPRDDDSVNIGSATCHDIPLRTCLGPGESACFDEPCECDDDTCVDEPCEDHACDVEANCLDGTVCPLMRTTTATTVDEENGGEGEWMDEDAGSEVSGTTEDGGADGPVGAAASADADNASTATFLWHTVSAAVRNVERYAHHYGTATWPSIVWQRSDTQEWLVTITEAAQQTWETAAEPTYLQQTYSEEIVMLHVANSLDEIAAQLQDAAHFLRFKAADRIVSKGQRRRVANR